MPSDFKQGMSTFPSWSSGSLFTTRLINTTLQDSIKGYQKRPQILLTLRRIGYFLRDCNLYDPVIRIDYILHLP